MASYIKPDDGRLVINSTLNFADLEAIVDTESALLLKGGAYINNDLYIGGTLIANGDIITIGNTGGSLTLNSNISSDVIPTTTNNYNLGSNNKQWDKIYANKILMTQITSNAGTEVSVDHGVSYITSATNVSPTLPDGELGQLVTIVATEALNNPVTLSPDNGLGYTTVTFNNLGDSIYLMWTPNGWAIISHFRTSIT